MKSTMRFAALAAGILVLGSFSACTKKPKPDESVAANAATDETGAGGDSDSGRAMGLQTVHFPFDAYTLSSETKQELKSNADILKSHPTVKVQIEGHCDQRGGIQYNIALGEKRANAVKHYLTDLGVADDRLTTISYGKERPLDRSETEEAYAKNRRANFVITSR